MKRWLKRLCIVVVVLAGVLSAMAIMAGYLATKYLVGHFAPSFKHVPSDYGVHAEAIDFHSLDGTGLKGWWIPTAETRVARGTVILAHGYGDNRSGMLSRAIFLAAKGYNAFPIDLRAHGESAGGYVAFGYVDILGAVQAVKRRGATGPIVLFGHSYGARASLWAAAHSNDIAAVIADSAFVSVYGSLRRWEGRAKDDRTLSWEMRSAIRLVTHLGDSASAKAFLERAYTFRTGAPLDIPIQFGDVLPAISQMGNRPVMFIAGGRDPFATPEDARRMYDVAQSPSKAILIIPNAGHLSTYETDENVYQRRVLDFFNSALPQQGEQAESGCVKKMVTIQR